MSTSAIIVFEKFGKAIYVGVDGYASVIGDALRRLEGTTGFESLFAYSDYRTLAGGVGVPALSQLGELKVIEGAFGKPYVTDTAGEIVSADFFYVVRATGEVVLFDDFHPIHVVNVTA